MKLKTLYKKTGIIVIILTMIMSSVFFLGFKDNNFEISKNLDIYFTLFKELNLYYVDETDPGDLIKTSIDAMLKSLDPYTSYIPESKMEDFRFMTTGQYGGIGALIRKSKEYVIISEPYEKFPAFKAGLKAGDIILEIDGVSAKNKSTSDISELLKGQPKTSVKLLIKRYNEKKPIEKTLTREQIKIDNVPYYGMMNDEIGYIRLSNFTSKAAHEVKKALIDITENQKAKSIILDLRGNPGGLLIESVNITNLFVPKGQEIVSTKGKVKQWDKTYKAMFDPIDTKIPVVILVNQGSASASEIVSGAIQDLDRGVIIGKRTFGKGLVQTTRQLSYNSKLKITTAKYYIPSGRCIQALDYSHRNEDGSVGKVPDSLISEYYTKNKRKVYDGGGIIPDIITENEYLSKIAISLVTKNHIFDYATKYAYEHDTIISPKQFKLSENEYNNFILFLSDKDYDYKSKSEETLKELEKTAKKEKYYTQVEDEFKILSEKLEHDKNKDLITFKDEIIDLLSEEIVSRYYYQKGRIEYVLQYDKDIKKAIEVLNDNEEYYTILNGKVDDKSKSD
ncbi:MAG: S41 family peptidase [Bacteroidales bacterium]|nr:S41 family peptidase [Bacteroidales bacterium]